MTLLQAFAATAYNLLRGSSNKLSLKAVQAWVTDHANRDNYGRGYSGSRLSRGPSNGFVEIVKQPRPNGKVNVVATVYFDPRQGSVASKTWTNQRLNSDLEKFFGKNLRVRIEV